VLFPQLGGGETVRVVTPVEDAVWDSVDLGDWVAIRYNQNIRSGSFDVVAVDGKVVPPTNDTRANETAGAIE